MLVVSYVFDFLSYLNIFTESDRCWMINSKKNICSLSSLGSISLMVSGMNSALG